MGIPRELTLLETLELAHKVYYDEVTEIKDRYSYDKETRDWKLIDKLQDFMSEVYSIISEWKEKQ